ncbi:MAG: hypothetical protein AB1512_31940 [Thermodesulfobacteriota bacterium]
MDTIILNIHGEQADRELLSRLLEMLFPECRIYVLSREETAPQIVGALDWPETGCARAAESQGARWLGS